VRSDSLTASICGELAFDVPKQRRPGNGEYLIVRGAPRTT
jgi:hypothetical protein